MRLHSAGREGDAVLILIAHGSHDPRWREPFERLTDTLQAELGANRVRLAFMECTPPTLMDAAAEAVRLGRKHIRVLPLFLAGGGHVDHDIPPLVDEVRARYPSLRAELLPPIGQHPRFVELMRRLAADAAED